MEFEIRPLNMRDIAPMARIISAMGIREFSGALSLDFVQSLMAQAESEDDKADFVATGMMLDIAGILLANYDKAEKDIISFLASVSGITAKEVGELPLADCADLVFAVLTAPDIKDFLSRAASLLRSAGAAG